MGKVFIPPPGFLEKPVLKDAISDLRFAKPEKEKNYANNLSELFLRIMNIWQEAFLLYLCRETEYKSVPDGYKTIGNAVSVELAKNIAMTIFTDVSYYIESFGNVRKW